MSEIITLESFLKMEELKKGSWISREVKEDRNYTIVSSKSGHDENQNLSVKKGQKILGRFIQEKNGVIEAAGQVTNFEVIFKGHAGFVNGRYELHKMCSRLYSIQECGIITYSIGDEQYDVLSEPRKEKVNGCNKKESIEELDKTYWIANQVMSGTGLRFGMNYIEKGNKDKCYLFDFTNSSDQIVSPQAKNVCPWHTIAVNNPNVKIIVGARNDGLSPNTAYEIVFD